MHGKTTLILTDKDTGRVVRKIEESNMATNAVSSIFSCPREALLPSNTRKLFEGAMPMYEHLLKGVVLFGDNIEENASRFMIGNRGNIIATAGDSYSGTDIMRGTFNESQSCETANGYRFVWDFAPEKAVGTIKCVALTHRQFGNIGSDVTGDLTVEAGDFSDATNSEQIIFSCQGTFLGELENGVCFTYATSGSSIVIRKYSMPDLSAVRINDKKQLTLTETLTCPTTVSVNSNYCSSFYDHASRTLSFTLRSSYRSSDSTNRTMIKIVEADPVTGEIKRTITDLYTPVPYDSYAKACCYAGKIYVALTDGTLYVCTLDGAVIRTVDIGGKPASDFFLFDGILSVRISILRRTTTYFNLALIGDTVIWRHEERTGLLPAYYPRVHAPYCVMSQSQNVKLMLRTDYLATINNLSSPLEKTDQHALQIRYELTN